jgi:hypothetical protein
MTKARRLTLAAAVAAALAVAYPGVQAKQATLGLPATLTAAQFWTLSRDLSEQDGFFRSENLVSNEHTYQYVIPALQVTTGPGGVYLGVAPDQNFTYMAAVRPHMAFILDIRRGNLLQHLMYKALFELSSDRAEFVSRLFSKPRPAGLGTKSTVLDIFSAYARVATSEVHYRRNLSAMRTHLLRTRRLPLTDEDWTHLESIYFQFFWEGPALRYSSSPNFGGRGLGSGGSRFPTWEEMIVQTDWEGVHRSYLATEENFRFIKGLQQKNLIVPVVGNFSGPKALRAIGRYVRERGSVVSAYYVSNVEQYLFQDGLFEAFGRNVRTLPVDDRSTFIRSVSQRFGYPGQMAWSDGRASALYPIRQFVRDFELGLLRTYSDVNARSR